MQNTLAVAEIHNQVGKVSDEILDTLLSIEEQYIFTVLQEVKEKAEKVFKEEFPLIPFTTDLRGRVAGAYRSGKKKYLRFNLECFLLNQSNYDSTIIHEFAHYVTEVRYGRGHGHDGQWKYVMRMLGESPEVYHDLKVRAVRKVKRNNVYFCDCREHKVSDLIHRRMQAGQKRHCTRCGSNLRK
jgi:predicted SprT family Zn-dependent metalloprotease